MKLHAALADNDERAFREYRQRAIFEANKWDAQIYDHSALSKRALLLAER